MVLSQVQILGWEDPLEEGTKTYSSILAWRIPWTEEPGGLQSTGSHRVKRDWSDLALQYAKSRTRLSEFTSHTHPNADFQRTARRDKKAFISDQCREIEENKRMGKTRDFFKKTRDTKGTFHAKMGSIKDRNGMEAEDIQNRWQEYTELYKRGLHDPDNHDGVITHLEPDILDCEVKWALGSILWTKWVEVMECQQSDCKS